jgi:hypothetical protein
MKGAILQQQVATTMTYCLVPRVVDTLVCILQCTFGSFISKYVVIEF